MKVGEKVRVIGEIIRKGRNIIHANAEIRDMNNKLISTGKSNLLKTLFIPDYVKTTDKL